MIEKAVKVKGESLLDKNVENTEEILGVENEIKFEQGGVKVTPVVEEKIQIQLKFQEEDMISASEKVEKIKYLDNQFLGEDNPNQDDM